jgi:16S rRNA (guanine966-N2)-methyltransferase
MRIVGGIYKGRKYSGVIPDEIRPTTDNVRESIFNILSNYINFDGITVADICAGTGFLGFEAMSRGAGYCYFFEKSKKSTALISTIADSFKIPKENYKIIFGDAVKSIKSFAANFPGKKLDLIFFDPPYESGLFNPVIDAVTLYSLAEKGAIFVIEHDNKTKLILPDSWDLLDERTYGGTGVIFAKNSNTMTTIYSPLS